jgi:hypothetical protein
MRKRRVRSRLATILVSASALIAAPFVASPQQATSTTLIPEDPTYPQCTVRLTTLFTVGGPTGSEKIKGPRLRSRSTARIGTGFWGQEFLLCSIRLAARLAR